jgi:glycosyltransferase involved in cell wall biosynthesis
MSRRNILYFSSFGTMKGGGQKSLLLLVRLMNRDRFVPKCVAPAGGDFCEFLEGERVPCFVVPMESIKSLRVLRTIGTVLKVYRLIREEDIHLVHTDGPRNTFYAGLAAKLAGIPAVFHVRVSEKPRFEDRILAFLVDAFVFVSESSRERFRWLGKEVVQSVVYNGIDLREFEDSHNDPGIPEVEGRPSRRLSVGCIARIEEPKGQIFLLEAIPEIIQEAGGADFYFIGEQDEAYMKALSIRTRGVEEYVHFTGFVEDPFSLMKSLDLVVLPSLSEGFSRVILEAMALKKPVVATKVGGNPEAVVHGTTGFLVPPADPKALVQSIVALLSDPKKRESMGKAGFERVKSTFDIHKNVREIEGIYSRLLPMDER